MSQLQEKQSILNNYLRSLGSVAVAFSGGVDSTFLLKSAHDVLAERVIAVTARSCSFPERELREAAEFCRREGIRQMIVDSEELDIEGFSSNPVNRCYLCKRELFEKIREVADANGIREIAEGSNLDDNGDYRPGLTAVSELNVRSPLRHAGLNKQDIRDLSRELGLPTWDKQSFACLSSRFVYGESITREKLYMVDRAEQLLLDLGFRQVRVRIHGTIGRIEVGGDELPKLVDLTIRTRISTRLHELGFTYVTLDLDGYQTGSMNRTLVQDAANGKVD